MTYHLYITNKNYTSWSLRPWLLLRELNIPFVEELRPIDSGSFRQPQWREFSPVATVPCLHVVPDKKEDDETLVLWESLAIVDFLAEEHPTLPIYPLGNRAARAWARSAVAEMHAGFGAVRQVMGMNVGVRVELDEKLFEGKLGKELERLGELWGEGLRRFGGPWLAGKEFGAVDAFYAPVAIRLRTYGAVGRVGDEVVRGWVERVLECQGVRDWVAEALKESGREVLHEKETVEGEGRRLVEDLRVKKT